MTKKLSTRSREVAEAIAACRPFTTHGALRAQAGSVGPWDAGRLSGADLDRYRADMSRIVYTVFSYATPIAWVTSDGKAYRVAQRFSVTTSKHQGTLYLLP